MSKDNEKLEKEGEDNDWSLEQGFWTTAYWINFILCSVSFFLSTAFSLLSKIPVLGFFAKPLEVSFGIIANLSWIALTKCESKVGWENSLFKSQLLSSAYGKMTEHEMIAGVFGVIATVAIGLGFIFPPLGLAMGVVAAAMITFSNVFWSQGEEVRKLTLKENEPFDELKDDVVKAHNHQVRYSKFSAASTLLLTASCIAALIFPPAAIPIAALSVFTVAIGAIFKIANIIKTRSIENRRNILIDEKNTNPDSRHFGEETALLHEHDLKLRSQEQVNSLGIERVSTMNTGLETEKRSLSNTTIHAMSKVVEYFEENKPILPSAPCKKTRSPLKK
ncbi:MAG: hypothetical protein HON32_07585 [Francisellaceae bacterium]|nr:hypothetical protein [Francisellaceae bacterium]MBT6538500.1 hypothetical protein [Francisellaceae bacterium]